MSSSGIEWALERLAREIVDRHKSTEGLLLVGIRRRGVHLADRLGKKIWEISKLAPPVKPLSISFYRADLSTIAPRPVLENPTLPFSVKDKSAILVDDVLYTGSTVCVALHALTSHAPPQRIELCVLIDRSPQAPDPARLCRQGRSDHGIGSY
jgi:pyrimidine operon attenuation protein/uracil phosphoribosyltransferase